MELLLLVRTVIVICTKRHSLVGKRVVDNIVVPTADTIGGRCSVGISVMDERAARMRRMRTTPARMLYRAIFQSKTLRYLCDWFFGRLLGSLAGAAFHLLILFR